MQSKIIGTTFFLFILSFGSYSQLPQEWIGHYVGELTSVNLQGKTSNYHMELKLNERKDSTYNFTIIYGEDSTRQERAYQLIPDGSNHFVLDEKNGILISMSLGNERLVSLFEVQENFLHVSYIFTENGLRFELTSSKPAGITGGTTTDSHEEIPLVTAYKTIAFQSAILKKQK
jgi:hypothetical protein